MLDLNAVSSEDLHNAYQILMAFAETIEDPFDKETVQKIAASLDDLSDKAYDDAMEQEKNAIEFLYSEANNGFSLDAESQLIWTDETPGTCGAWEEIPKQFPRVGHDVNTASIALHNSILEHMQNWKDDELAMLSTVKWPHRVPTLPKLVQIDCVYNKWNGSHSHTYTVDWDNGEALFEPYGTCRDYHQYTLYAQDGEIHATAEHNDAADEFIFSVAGTDDPITNDTLDARRHMLYTLVAEVYGWNITDREAE